MDTQKAMITKLVSAEAETDLFLTGLGMAAAQYDLAVNVKTVKCEGNQRLFINGTSMTCVATYTPSTARAPRKRRGGCAASGARRQVCRKARRPRGHELCPENHYCCSRVPSRPRRGACDVVSNELCRFRQHVRATAGTAGTLPDV